MLRPCLALILLHMLKFYRCQAYVTGVENTVNCIKDTNRYRYKHYNTGRLKWDTVLAQQAQAYAEKLMRIANIKGYVGLIHDPMKPDNIGETLFTNMSPRNVADCREANNYWYNEKYGYNEQNPVYSKRYENFAQLVWKGTKRFGMGRVVFQDPILKRWKDTIIVARFAKGLKKNGFKYNVRSTKMSYRYHYRYRYRYTY